MSVWVEFATGMFPGDVVTPTSLPTSGATSGAGPATVDNVGALPSWLLIVLVALVVAIIAAHCSR